MLRRLSLVVVPILLGAFALSQQTARAENLAISHHPRIAQATRSTGWASSNWSGYSETGTYTSATARWVVPAVSPSRGSSYSSSWVGIDGFNNSDLIQTGTEQDWYNGAPLYRAWWEILPAAETVITSITVHPGDVFTASITKGANSVWTISINDTTTGQSFSTQQTYTGPGTSVEWIEEAPSIGGHTATLANYGQATFDPGTANGVDPQLTAADSGEMIQKNRVVSIPSAPDADAGGGDGFNVAYGSTAPSPPAS